MTTLTHIHPSNMVREKKTNTNFMKYYFWQIRQLFILGSFTLIWLDRPFYVATFSPLGRPLSSCPFGCPWYRRFGALSTRVCRGGRDESRGLLERRPSPTLQQRTGTQGEGTVTDRDVQTSLPRLPRLFRDNLCLRGLQCPFTSQIHIYGRTSPSWILRHSTLLSLDQTSLSNSSSVLTKFTPFQVLHCPLTAVSLPVLRTPTQQLN